MELTVNDHRVDHGAAVIHRHILRDIDLARLRVHLDRADMRTEREGEVRRVVDVRRLETGLRPLREAVGRPGGEGDLLDRLRFVGRALHREPAGVELQVLGRNLQQMRGDQLRLLQNTLAGVVKRDAAHRDASAPIGVHPERRDGGIAVQHGHVVERNAQRIRGDLRPRRLVPLPVGGRTGDDFDLARRQTSNDSRVPAAGPVAQRSEDLRRCEAAHLHIGGEADPELLRITSFPTRLLLFAELVVVNHLERAVEARLIVGRVELEAAGARDQLAGGQEVPPAHLHRIETHLVRQRVDRALYRIGRLGTTRTAIGVRGSRVAEDAGALQRVGLSAVAPAVDERAEQGHTGRDELQVRPHVHQQLHPVGVDLPLFRGRELDLLDEIAPMGRGEISLGALLDPLDRASEPPRQCEADRLLGVDVELRAEPAAYIRRDDTELGFRYSEGHGEGDPGDVRDLRGRPHGKLAGSRHRLHHYAAGLDGVRDEPRLKVPLLYHNLRILERGVDIAVTERPGVAAIRAEILVHERSAVGERRLDLGDDGQWLIVHLHQLGGVLRLGPARRNDHRHRVTEVPDHLLRHRPVVGNLDVFRHRPRTGETRRPVVRELRSAERGHHARLPQGRRQVHTDDRRVS